MASNYVWILHATYCQNIPIPKHTWSNNQIIPKLSYDNPFKVEECKSHVLIRTLSYFSKWKRYVYKTIHL